MSNETLKQKNKIHYLYRIINKINNKVYIGQTVEPNKRWYQHRRDAANPTMVIHNAINKYGAHNFEFEVIASCKTWEDANEIETLLIAQYDSLVENGKGYNVALGGYNAPKSDAWKQAMKEWRASLSPEEWNKINEKRSEATFKQIAEKGHPAAGRIVSQETRDLMRKIRLENPIEYTEEIRKNMSEAHMGHKDSEETKAKKSESAKKGWSKRICYDDFFCNAPGCEIKGKAAYKLIDGTRYCNKHGLRLLRYGRLDCIR